MKQNFNIGIVADWLVTYAGAEKVLAELFNIYPEATLYSVIDFLSDKDREKIGGATANTTFIQKMPYAKTKYQKYLPILPFAIEQLDVSAHNVIISSSHAVAKGVLTGPDQLHISYVHSPIRYAWDLQHQYLKSAGLNSGLKGMMAKYFLSKMRIWDYRTANGVDHFIANSHFIARRIKKVYGRSADVIYPPVNVDRFIMNEKKDEYYLTASRMVPYKRIDLIVEAFSHMPDKKLVVIGDGSEMNKVKSLAGRNVEILGYQDDDTLINYMKDAKAFVFCAEEDFGITPVEAQACGTPVIAFGKGGSLETIIPIGNRNSTGVFFDSQNVKSIINAVELFENNQHEFSPLSCRKNSERFSEQRFRIEMNEYVSNKWNEFEIAKKIHY
ncbi:glycosyltransferase family 4 protein [Serratia fonticola]|uniref:glycosyltransferase family 4 protein n=1 Tax=Serratia fonticola TaxID=47917 RepID=UPI0015757165|nr:glycosyltransferase family 4 protein [Serratia fonticola]NTY86846.1 glycosyltransferase family 4 protein [Serratia fonticola]NTZ12819.1 glycosyltransferase family 4 protein [Serratia fonticola]